MTSQNRIISLPYLAYLTAAVCTAAASMLLATTSASGQQPPAANRCEIVPLADHRVSFRVDGVEKTCWHFGPQYPRPFFFPFNGPSGGSLTRMGHPGAPNHDHHRSVWFAHHSVNGVDYWSENTEARIRQKSWLAYTDGDDEAVMASLLTWFDDEGRQAMEQELVAALRPLADGEHALELQITLRPPAGEAEVQLDKTNFGLLAVRVAKSLSAHFGGGKLSGSEGESGEAALFGKPARWMNYSGPLTVGEGPERTTVAAGITYFDHPANPRYPTHWHVRDDGWMGASFCMQEGHAISAEQPLVLRYLLHAHGGAYDAARAAEVQQAFAARPGFRVSKSSRPHHQFEVSRAE